MKKRLRMLDSGALAGLRTAVDGYERYQQKDPEARKYFQKIIRLMLDLSDMPSPYAVLSAIAEESERRAATAKVKLINPDTAGLISGLTDRQREILYYLGKNFTYQEIMKKMNLSYNTLKTHKLNIAARLGLGSSKDLARFAAENLEELKKENAT